MTSADFNSESFRPDQAGGRSPRAAKESGLASSAFATQQAWQIAGLRGAQRRRTPVLLPGLLVAAVVFINEASFRVADQANFSVDWQVLLRLAVCGLCGLYALNYLPAAWTALERFPQALVLLFGIWCVVTVPFSVNVPYAAVSCAALWCVILFTPVALLHLGPKRLFLAVLGSLAAFALSAYFVAYLAPPFGREEVVTITGDVRYRLAGLSHPNGLGRQMALMLLVGMFLGSQKLVTWRRLAPALLLALLTLYATNSRTSMLAVAAAATCLLVESSVARGRAGKLVLLATALAAAAAVAVVSLRGLDTEAALGSMSRTGEVDEMYTFSGRTDIWRYALGRIAEAPVTGYGCGCARFPMSRYEGFAITHAHNLLLNVTLNTGIFGGFLVAVALLIQVRAAFVKPSPFPDMMTVLVLVFAFADIPLFSVVPDAPTLLWIVSMLWRPMIDQQPAEAKEAA